MKTIKALPQERKPEPLTFSQIVDNATGNNRPVAAFGMWHMGDPGEAGTANEVTGGHYQRTQLRWHGNILLTPSQLSQERAERLGVYRRQIESDRNFYERYLRTLMIEEPSSWYKRLRAWLLGR